MANDVQVMINGEVTSVPLDGLTETEVLNEVKSQLVGVESISPNAKAVEMNGYYTFEEPHGTAG